MARQLDRKSDRLPMTTRHQDHMQAWNLPRLALHHDSANMVMDNKFYRDLMCYYTKEELPQVEPSYGGRPSRKSRIRFVVWWHAHYRRNMPG